MIEGVPLFAYGEVYESGLIFVVIIGVYTIEDRAVQVFANMSLSLEEVD